MILRLRSNFDLGTETMELGAPEVSLRDLLLELARRGPGDVDYIDRKTGDVDELFEVYINGKDYRFLPRRLDTLAKDGDEVQISVIPFGGG